MSNRRTGDRLTYRVDVRGVRDGEVFDAFSEDVSAGGMRLVCNDGTRLQVGERVRLKFNLPGLPIACEIEARVRWLDDAAGTMAGVFFGDGLRAREVSAINRLQHRAQA